MKRLVRLAVSTGIAGSMAAFLAPAAPAFAAAVTTTTGTCISVTDTETFADGQITICPQADGSVHVSGYLEPLIYSDFFDLHCVAWEFLEGSNYGELGFSACPGSSSTYKHPFDYSFTPAHTITGAQIAQIEL